MGPSAFKLHCAMSLSVFVDDTDSDIKYTGPWFADVGTLDSFGNFGPPYLSTLHGINAPGLFSYSFRGPRALITSTIQFPTVGNITNPSWQCFVDGELVPSKLYRNGNNNLDICDQDGLNDSSHTITVVVDVSDDHTFWLDYIVYVPFPDTPINTSALSISVTDPEIQLGLWGNWTRRYPGYYTQSSDSSFQFQFDGVSLQWLGFYDNALPMEATTGAYSIDGQPPVSFNLNGTTAKDTHVQYSQVFFQTPLLEAKTHTLEVLYQGDATKTPLSLFRLQTQNGTTPSLSSTLSGQRNTLSLSSFTSILSSATPAASVALSGVKQSKNNKSVLIGGILGGICLILGIGIIGFVIFRKHRRHSVNSQNTGSSVHLLSSTAEIARKCANLQGGHPAAGLMVSSLTTHQSIPTQAAVPTATSPLPGAEGGTSSSQSASASTSLPYTTTRSQDEAAQRRDVDSGLRFHTTNDSMTLPPLYTPM
ncbi:hypothetical protein D9613_002592 [Agrocybe pediades]|uniref:Transmembrane protein n=1 Tax=Agrocybe pediades TaxID=84607 RepID=A0A8H4QRC7_9AGAR|nr:hypothetical protein D9613_002592 [Agrocybe pediades]